MAIVQLIGVINDPRAVPATTHTKVYANGESNIALGSGTGEWLEAINANTSAWDITNQRFDTALSDSALTNPGSASIGYWPLQYSKLLAEAQGEGIQICNFGYTDKNLEYYIRGSSQTEVRADNAGRDNWTYAFDELTNAGMLNFTAALWQQGENDIGTPAGVYAAMFFAHIEDLLTTFTSLNAIIIPPSVVSTSARSAQEEAARRYAEIRLIEVDDMTDVAEFHDGLTYELAGLQLIAARAAAATSNTPANVRETPLNTAHTIQLQANTPHTIWVECLTSLGVELDLTRFDASWSATMTVMQNPNWPATKAGNVVASYTTTSTRTRAPSTVEFDLSSTQTSLKPGRYFYDIVMTYNSVRFQLVRVGGLHVEYSLRRL